MCGFLTLTVVASGAWSTLRVLAEACDIAVRSSGT